MPEVRYVDTNWLELRPTGPNRLTNPSFATDHTTGWEVAPGGLAGATVTRSRDAAVFSDAAGGLKTAIGPNTAGTGGVVSYRTAAASMIPVVPGGAYSAAVDIRTTTADLRPTLSIGWWTVVDGVRVAELVPAAVSSELTNPPLNTWVRRIARGVPPEGATHADIWLNTVLGAAGVVGDSWHDNVVFGGTVVSYEEEEPGTVIVTIEWREGWF